MKRSTILVGGGVIATHYKKGLENSETLRLDALVDLNPDCVARSQFDIPFFTDLDEALKLNPHIALLALPVAAHDDVARKLLAKGICVYTEKPMFESLDEITSCANYAKECGAYLACMFHWKAADEVRFLKANLSRFGKITAISAQIFDDYAATADGSIRSDRLGLMGAWVDSGINVLSYYDEIIDLSRARLLEETLISDSKSGLVKFAKKAFDCGGVRAEIVIDWRTESRDKTSRIECERGSIFVDHAAQTVRLNDEVIFQSKVEDRLSSHYANLFHRLSPETIEGSQKSTYLLHKLLYTGNAR